MSCQPIGLFDSGVGGLSVFSELRRQLPDESLVYFADSLHMPYGPRSPQELHQLVFAILQFLRQQNVKLVVMACNTSSAIVLPAAREQFPLPIIGMIEPVVQQLASSPVARLGVMATEATVKSGTYDKALREAGYQGEIYCQPCPELATLIETGVDNGRLVLALHAYSLPLKQARVEQVVLGCTHYPFAIREISAALGEDISLINPAVGVAATVKRLLTQERMLCTSKAGAHHVVAYVSGSLTAFKSRSRQLLGYAVEARQVRLNDEQAVYQLIN